MRVPSSEQILDEVVRQAHVDGVAQPDQGMTVSLPAGMVLPGNLQAHVISNEKGEKWVRVVWVDAVQVSVFHVPCDERGEQVALGILQLVRANRSPLIVPS